MCGASESYKDEWYYQKTTCRKCYTKKWHADNPHKNQEYWKRIKPKVVEKNRAYGKIWYTANKARLSLLRKAHYHKNKAAYLARCWKRRAMKLKACPVWSDLLAIREIYKLCPKGFEVDHIIPLQGKDVCGLHVSWNLQYLTRAENRSKGNRL